MKKVRDLIRLKYETRLSHEQIARALSISKGVVAKYVGRVDARGLDPTVLLALDEGELAQRLPSAPQRPQYGGRVAPDYAEVHRELKRPGVTLTLLREEYRRAHEGAATSRYSQFAERHREYLSTLRRSMRQVHRAGEKLLVDYAGDTVATATANARRSSSACSGRATTRSRARRPGRRWTTGSRRWCARLSTSRVCRP
ncbi:MAG: hypothetical protein O9284_05605 [Steroidobacteraceae bacterium]|jgi:hypothetical protein|nr:hypothetical protein [Steroidobacteraceae bacterium]